MLYVKLTAKKKGLNQEKLDQLQMEKTERLEREERKGSTGVHGKGYEPNVRHLLTVHGLSENDFHARTNGSNTHIVEDGVLMINGRRIKYEVKSGDGIVGYIEPTEQPVFDENDIFPGIELIMYTAEPKKLDSEDMILDRTLVLTREQFLAFIACEGPKRAQSVRTAVKFGTNDHTLREINTCGGNWKDCITLQPTYRAARAAACKGHQYKTLRDFLQELGRI